MRKYMIGAIKIALLATFAIGLGVGIAYAATGDFLISGATLTADGTDTSVANTIDTEGGADTIKLGDGGDTIDLDGGSTDGNDTIDVGNGTNNLTFGSGVDTISFGTGNDVLDFGTGDTNVYFGAATNTIWWGGSFGIMNYEFAFSANDDYIYYYPGAGATDDTLITRADNLLLQANNGDVVIQLGN